MKFFRLFSFSGIIFLAAAQAGCIGVGIPSLTRSKPYSYLHGDQFGRDQLANRWLVGSMKLPIKGKNQNEVITLLGQPQQIDILERHISEDWYFIYYKRYKTSPETPEGSFLVRFYNQQVIDVVSLT